MKIFVAGAACKFAGIAYSIGQTIPADHIDPNRVNSLVRMGTIKVIEAPDPEPPKDQEPPENPEMPENPPKDQEPPENPGQDKGKEKTGKTNRRGKKVE